MQPRSILGNPRPPQPPAAPRVRAAAPTEALPPPSSRERAQRIGDMLVEQGLISVEQLEEALTLQKQRKVRVGRLFVELGFVTEVQLAELVADQLRVPCMDASAVTIAPDALRCVPQDLAVQHRCLPWRLEGRELFLLMADPTDLAAIDAIAFKSGQRIRPVVLPDHQITAAIEKHYGVKAEDALEYFDHVDLLDQLSVVDDIDVDDVEDLSKAALATPVVRLVNAIFIDAIRAGASDIHIEPQLKGVDMRYRVDGALRRVMNIPKRSQAKIVSRIKIAAHLDIAERRRPQDGRLRISLNGSAFDMRVSTLPTADGEKVVVRILASNRARTTLADLGFEEELLAQFTRLLRRPQGLILVTGPTGSGKTSTLYAALNYLRGETTNIVTIEDPIEYRLEGVNQVAVNEKAGLTFAEGLRSILRQDPDVLMVGEIRDRETAEIAFQAAQTGHLVLATLHTNDAPSAVTRLLNMGVPGYLITASLLGVQAQRLVRTICACRRGVSAAAPEPATPCPVCRGIGLHGRTAIHELMRMTPQLRSLLMQVVSSDDLRLAAEAAGMRSLYANGLQKVHAGVTTMDELLRVAAPPDDGEEGTVALDCAMA